MGEIDLDYYNAKLAEIPQEVLDKAVKVIKDIIVNEDEIAEIKMMHALHGSIDWAVGHHHGWGMHIRNILRAEKLTDDLLPDKNWDDYYIQVVELALGLRK